MSSFIHLASHQVVISKAGPGFCEENIRQEHKELLLEALNTNFAKTFMNSTYILLF